MAVLRKSVNGEAGKYRQNLKEEYERLAAEHRNKVICPNHG
jgi:hypothetical protein